MTRDISALLSHSSDNWVTPIDIIQDLVKTRGIAVDVACTSENCRLPLGLTIDQGIDGLKFDWSRIPVLSSGEGAAFNNPPHSQIVDWIKKCIMESRKGVRVIMLIPAATGTDHWHDLILTNAAIIEEVKHRIYFTGRIKVPGQSRDTPKDQIQYKIGAAPATFDSAIVTFDINLPRINGKPLRTEYIQPKDRVRG